MNLLANRQSELAAGLSRRDMLARLGNGCGLVALAAMLAEDHLIGPASVSAAENAAPAVTPLSPKAPHFEPRATRVIYLFMNGGPSQVDTFDPKPSLEKHAGEAPPAELVN